MKIHEPHHIRPRHSERNHILDGLRAAEREKKETPQRRVENVIDAARRAAQEKEQK